MPTTHEASPKRMFSQFDDIEDSSMMSSTSSQHEAPMLRAKVKKTLTTRIAGDYDAISPRQGAFGKLKEKALPMSAYKIKKMRAKAFHDLNEGFRQ